MICPQCGTDMKKESACPECGRPANLSTVIRTTQPEARECADTHPTASRTTAGTSVPVGVPDNLLLAVFAAIFFPYLGVFALIQAAKAKQFMNAGEHEKALAASLKARQFSLMAFAGAAVQIGLTILILLK